MTDLIRLTYNTPHIARITLNSPETLNALTWEMGEAFESAVATLKVKSDLRLVLVTGAGRAFSSGGNMAFIKENYARDPKENQQLMVRFYKKFLAIAEVPVPTLALLHGPAVGAGLAFALACDLRLATATAKLGVNFTRIGLTPGMGSSFFLPRIVGAARATELFFTGRLVSGNDAHAMGLVHDVFATPDTLLEHARNLANTLCQNAPLALRGTKRLLTRDLAGLDDALRLEAKEQAIAFASADIREGIAAIEAKRTPQFMGK